MSTVRQLGSESLGLGFNAHFNRVPFQILEFKEAVSTGVSRGWLDRHSAACQPLMCLLQIFGVEDDMSLLRECAWPQLH
jgi:hypothetical protein